MAKNPIAAILYPEYASALSASVRWSWGHQNKAAPEDTFKVKFRGWGALLSVHYAIHGAK